MQGDGASPEISAGSRARSNRINLALSPAVLRSLR